MQTQSQKILEALEVLALPPFIRRIEVKEQYRFLAKKYHPDRGGSAIEMEKLNDAYAILIEYIEGFRYTFDEEEIGKQFAGESYVQRFKS